MQLLPAICSLLLLATVEGRGRKNKDQLDKCIAPPSWTDVNGTDVLKESRGQVTLLVLLRSNWQYCQVQTFRLQKLLNSLKKGGRYPDAQFMALNMHGHEDTINLLTKWATFPVYQEPKDENVFKLMKGSKDDMFILDRCGRLHFHIPRPWSDLRNKIVSRLYKRVYHGLSKQCAKCSKQKE